MKLRWMVPVIALLAAGCIKEKTLIVVNGDGSGNIVLDTSMTKEAAAMMQQTAASFSSAFGATNEAGSLKQEDLIKEEDLRERASDFGPGVEFVRLKRTSDGGGQGAVAVYSFKDVNTVRLPLQQKNGAGGEVGGETEDADAAKPKKTVTFAFTPGDIKTLKISIPQDAKDKALADKKAKAAKPEGAPDLDAAMMGPMLQMFKGLEMSLAVQVKGELVKSNATHPEGERGERAVLMALNFDELMKSPQFGEIFQKSQGGDMPTGDLLGLAGFRYETNSQVVIQFK